MQRCLLFLILFSCERAAPVETVMAQPASNTKTEKAKPKPKKIPARVAQKDTGLFSSLDKNVTLYPPSWLSDVGTISVGIQKQTPFATIDGAAVALSAEADVTVADYGDDDIDKDGIPNQIDILIGAKKADLNDAAYGSPYRKLDYPLGDVPIEEGVCTDVIIRALRNAGIDLQKELHEDIKKSRKSFPMVKRPDPNIDQRRVKTLLPYFKRQWRSLPTKWKGAEHTWLPGDVVFMQTMGDKRPDHVGIVSDRIGESGAPVIINNWTDGSRTDELDLVDWVPITHRFRWRSKVPLPDEWKQLSGILKQTNLKLPANSTQAIVVTSGSERATTGELRVLEKSDRGWKVHLGPYDVALGAAGMKRGVDIMPNDVPPKKREGDKASPWGVFAIGTAFGTRKPPKTWAWPYRPVTEKDVWVDDPKSAHYNRWKFDSGDWNSAEQLTQYERALVIEHNTNIVRPGFGSAIFLHSWSDVGVPTLGCTALSRKKLDRVLSLLHETKKPVFVQTPVPWRD